VNPVERLIAERLHGIIPDRVDEVMDAEGVGPVGVWAQLWVVGPRGEPSGEQILDRLEAALGSRLYTR
jgi:hypothetical protein